MSKAVRDMLVKRWSQFAPSDRANCRQIEETGGALSYVEQLTCQRLRRQPRRCQTTRRFGRKPAR